MRAWVPKIVTQIESSHSRHIETLRRIVCQRAWKSNRRLHYSKRNLRN